ncbi:MAG TPA: hypothetical protein VFH72_04325 [Candidatus Baltobacteraceae bacterium]|nr:hypothetical protein [Candidatus Baltobacteraceae bacterium]
MNSLAYSVEDAVAVYFEGYLTIRATISVTATNMAAYLQRSPIMIYPPSHDFYACERQTSPIGADVIIPQTVTQIFPAPGGKPNTIKLIAKENTLDVDVRGVDPLAPSITAVTGKFERTANGETANPMRLDGGGGEVPSPFRDQDIFHDTATGYSPSLNFEEALRDAVSQLPPTHNPDELTSVRIIGMGAEFGGFAGLQRLWVTVSRLTIGPVRPLRTAQTAGASSS